MPSYERRKHPPRLYRIGPEPLAVGKKNYIKEARDPSLSVEDKIYKFLYDKVSFWNVVDAYSEIIPSEIKETGSLRSLIDSAIELVDLKDPVRARRSVRQRILKKRAPFSDHANQVTGVALILACESLLEGYTNWAPKKGSAEGWCRFIADAYSHDVLEDFDISKNVLAFMTHRLIANDIDLLSKNHFVDPHIKKASDKDIFRKIYDKSEWLSTIKIADRIVNLFSYNNELLAYKTEQYLNRSERFVLPLTNGRKVTRGIKPGRQDNPLIRQVLKSYISDLKKLLKDDVHESKKVANEIVQFFKQFGRNLDGVYVLQPGDQANAHLIPDSLHSFVKDNVLVTWVKESLSQEQFDKQVATDNETELQKKAAAIGIVKVKESDRIVLTLRDKNNVHTDWALPGGKVEKEENPAETFIREVKEEANIDIKKETLRLIIQEYKTFESPKKEQHQLELSVFLAMTDEYPVLTEQGKQEGLQAIEPISISFLPRNLILTDRAG